MKKMVLLMVVLFGTLGIAQAQYVGLRHVYSAVRNNVEVNGQRVAVMSSIYCASSIEGALLVKKIAQNSNIIPIEYVPYAFQHDADKHKNQCDYLSIVLYEMLPEVRDMMFEK